MSAVRHPHSVTRPLMFMCMGMGLYLLTLAQNPSPAKPALPAPKISRVKPVELPWGDRAYDTRLTVDLSDRVVYVHHKDQLTASYRLAIGQPHWETPSGTFRVRQMVKNPTWQHPLTDEVFPPGDANPLGDRWVGFAADEQMKLGFHGTKDEHLIGKAVSHGCLRMRNRDVRSLFDQVSIGTEVTVRP
jgi:L,D-transpeptidase ErfK/SrfK